MIYVQVDDEALKLPEMDIRWNRGKLKVTSPNPQYTVKRSGRPRSQRVILRTMKRRQSI